MDRSILDRWSIFFAFTKYSFYFSSSMFLYGCENLLDMGGFYFSFYREMDYDGIVLESWSRWAAYGILHDPEMRVMVHL